MPSAAPETAQSSAVPKVETGFLDLPRELRDEVYDDEFETLSIIRAYSLQIPFPTAYFATGDPFRFLQLHPQVRDEWLSEIPIEEEICVYVQSKPIDEYRRLHPLIKCDTIVTPLEKVFTPKLFIMMPHQLDRDLNKDVDAANEVQNERLNQVHSMLEYAQRLLRGVHHIIFAGDFGCHNVYNPPEPYGVNVHKDANINDVDPKTHAAMLKRKGRMMHLTENRHFAHIMDHIKHWHGGRIKTVEFRRGFFSANDAAAEAAIAAALQKKYARDDAESLKIVIGEEPKKEDKEKAASV